MLNPSFALSGTLQTSAPSYENMSPAEVEAFLTEMEADIRAADRDLREIEMLEKKDVTAAGRLPEYETLRPRLHALRQAHEEDLQKATDLEQRVAGLMQRYATNVRALPRNTILDSDVVSRLILCLSYSWHGTTHFGTPSSRWQGWRRCMPPRNASAYLNCDTSISHPIPARSGGKYIHKIS